jgi:hypothetical protein
MLEGAHTAALKILTTPISTRDMGRRAERQQRHTGDRGEAHRGKRGAWKRHAHGMIE